MYDGAEEDEDDKGRGDCVPESRGIGPTQSSNQETKEDWNTRPRTFKTGGFTFKARHKASSVLAARDDIQIQLLS